MDSFRDVVIDKHLPQSLQQQIYQAFKTRILSSRLKPGTRIESSRTLAQQLGLSRNTINAALDQLKAEGYLHSRPGSGNFVCNALPEAFFHRSGAQAEPRNKTSPKLSKKAEEIATVGLKRHIANGSFQPGVPALDAFPMKQWSQLMHEHGRRTSLMGFDDPAGYLPLREQLANYLRSSRGLSLNTDNIIITQGAQQAAQIAIQTVLNPGDLALVESPGYIGMRKALQCYGAKIASLPVTADGIAIAQLPTDHQARMIHLTPTHQYPMGPIMPLANRLALLHWAEKYNVWVVEDDYDSEYFYDHKPIAALQGLGFAHQTLYLGSFSKVLFPSLRLGYLVVPDALIEPCLRFKNFSTGHVPTLEQACVADFIERGWFMRHLKRMRILYQERQHALIHALQTQLSDVGYVQATGAGMHLVFCLHPNRLKAGQSDTDLVAALQRQHIHASALSAYYLDSPVQQGLVLGFSNTAAEKIPALVKQMATVIRSR